MDPEIVDGDPPQEGEAESRISWKFLMYMKLGQVAYFEDLPTEERAQTIGRRASVAAVSWAFKTDFTFRTGIEKNGRTWRVFIRRVG